MIDTSTGNWIQKHTGIGAGVDSFYEIILKSAILLGDNKLLKMFETAYIAIQQHSNFFHLNYEVDMNLGNKSIHSFIISSLQAFWPGLEVLSGRIELAIKSFDALYNIWEKYEALPDMYNNFDKSLNKVWGRDYPLRPELIESAYHLYMATKDQKYVRFGQRMYNMIENKCRVKCGYASIADVETGRLDDRMDSYFLAETLKYLYLLFDEAIPIPALRESAFCHEYLSSNTSFVESGLDIPDHKDRLEEIEMKRQSKEKMLNDKSNIKKNLSNLRGSLLFDSEVTNNEFIVNLPVVSPSSVQTACLLNDDICNVIPESVSRLSMPSLSVQSLSYPRLSDVAFNNSSFDTVFSEDFSVSSDGDVNQKLSSHFQRKKRPCISAQSSLFTTEGHVLLIEPSFRSLNQKKSVNQVETIQKSVPEVSFNTAYCPVFKS